MKIYTRTGDSGETSLFGGTRVRKDAPRVEAYGAVDELNAWLGLVRAHGLDAHLDGVLVQIQRDLFALGAQLADPTDRLKPGQTKAIVNESDIERLEDTIDRFEASLPPLRKFILAGGSAAGATLHVARTVCRRAERAMVQLGEGAFENELLQYVNRLSDLLFTMARAVNHRAGIADIEW